MVSFVKFFWDKNRIEKVLFDAKRMVQLKAQITFDLVLMIDIQKIVLTFLLTAYHSNKLFVKLAYATFQE